VIVAVVALLVVLIGLAVFWAVVRAMAS